MTQCVCACFSVDMHTNHSPYSFFLQRRHIETQTRRDWKTLTTESLGVNPTCLKAKGDGTGIHLSALTPTRVNHPACVFADMQQYTYNIKLMYGPFTGGLPLPVTSFHPSPSRQSQTANFTIHSGNKLPLPFYLIGLQLPAHGSALLRRAALDILYCTGLN